MKVEKIKTYETPQICEMEVSVEKGFAGSAAKFEDGTAGMDDMELDPELEW